MTALTLYGAETGNGLRAAIALAEAGLEHRIERVDLAGGEHRSAAFRALNPLGKTPVLVDDRRRQRLVITQSNAIMLHAAGLAPGRLAPLGDGAALARHNARLFFFITDVIAPSHAGFFLKAQSQTVAAAQMKQQAAAMMQTAESFLAEDRYMSGGAFGLADIAGFTIALGLTDILDWRAAPRLADWMVRTGERPAVIRGLAAFSDPPVSSDATVRLGADRA